MVPEKEILLPGPYLPTLILHGGAGNITRNNLPPALYDQYQTSLLKYLDSTRQWLNSASSALDAAVHAVSLMEDDPLFNCARGSVFTEEGTIEMEASVMVASLDPDRAGRHDGSMAAEHKRGASVSLIRNTRHPIQLAREVLLVKPNAKASSMHCQLSGPEVEEWGWERKGLERKDDAWFWTRKRWAEHLRGLQKHGIQDSSREGSASAHRDSNDNLADDEDVFLPSQGTVGAVCMDSWGDIAVATSTGGLTNKKVGRIGDTPTLGAGFWAESWEESATYPVVSSEVREPFFWHASKTFTMKERLARALDAGFGDWFQECLPTKSHVEELDELLLSAEVEDPLNFPPSLGDGIERQPRPYAGLKTRNLQVSISKSSSRRRRAIAVSGTGNGDTFLRTSACHSTAAICRYSKQSPTAQPMTLATAVNMTAGPDGELQKSAGDRWMVTGEGQAGIIGIEIWSDKYDSDETEEAGRMSRRPRATGRVVFDFNCGGLWRAWVDEKTGKGKVMVFREEYR